MASGRTCADDNVERQPWVSPCNIREVSWLTEDPKARGTDPAAFQAKDLLELIRGRTLWWVRQCRLAPLHLEPLT